MTVDAMALEEKIYNKKDDLYAWFRFGTDISSSGNLIDAAGSSLDLVPVSARPKFLIDAPNSLPTVSGFSKNSYSFDNVTIKSATKTDFEFDNGPSTPESAFSISAWVKFDPFSGDSQLIVSKYHNSTPALRQYILYLKGTDSYIYFDIYDGVTGKSFSSRATDLPIAAGKWHHIVATFSGTPSPAAGHVLVYVDGVATSTTTQGFGGAWSTNEIRDTDALFSIGNDYNSTTTTDFAGQIAEVALWKTSLTQDDITTLYSFKDKVAYSFSSGFVNLPPRVLLRQLDNATGSYPTVLRMGDKDRTGNYKRSFDDNYTINFGKKIKDAFELVNKEGSGTLGFSKEIRSDRWTHSVGMEIRQEILSTTSIEEKGNGALVFSSGETSAASGRWIQTKDKIKNPRVKLRLMIGPYNQDRTTLRYGLGLVSGTPTDVLKIQIDDNVSFSSPTDIKTIQNNIANILTQPATRTAARSSSDAARKIIEIDLYPADFPGDAGAFYLRIIQDSVSNKDNVIWALSEIEIDYHDEENISYPLMINTDSIVGQKIVSASVTAPHIAPTLKGPGRSISGISDVHLSFTPGEDISAFNDNSHFFDDTSIFFSQGTDPNILPGFSSPVSNKTIIEVDLSANEQTTFGMDSRTAVESTGGSFWQYGSYLENDPTVKQQLMVYWNKDLKRWEKIAQGISGNSALQVGPPPSPLQNMIHSGALGFSSLGMVSTGSAVTLSNQTPVNQDALFSYARPTSTFGFPFEGKYEATSSQAIKAKDLGITKPFLLEKCSISFESKFEFASNPFDSGSRSYSLQGGISPNLLSWPSLTTRADNQKVYIPTFFILRQGKDILNASIEYETELSGTRTGTQRTVSIPDPAVHLSTAPAETSIVSVDTSRELITYGQMTMFVSGVANSVIIREGTSFRHTQFDIDKMISNGLGRDKNVNILSMTGQSNFDETTSQLAAITGTFNINFPCRATSRIENTSYLSVVLTNSAGTRTPGAAFLGNTLGGRGDGSLAASSRTLVNGYGSFKPGEKYLHFSHDGISSPISLTPPAADTIDSISPYIILPEDEIVLGWQYPIPANILYSAPGKSDVFLNTMSLFGNSKLKLIGSIIKNKKEYHEGLNQNLSSNTIHEIVGAETPIDQFQVSKQGENLGNFYDTGVDSTATIPANRIGSETFSRMTTLLSDAGKASGTIVISSPAYLSPGLSIGVATGDAFGLEATDSTVYSMTASAATSTSANTFQLWGDADDYATAYYTILSLQGLIDADTSNLLFSTSFAAYFSSAALWSVNLTITQKIPGSAGNNPVTYVPAAARRLSTREFSGGTDGVAIRANSFARNVSLKDSTRIYTDSTGSTGDFSLLSTFGLMQALGGITPKYYFDSKKYGQFFDFIDQGKDSKFAQIRGISTLGFKGAALQSPVEITFVSGTNENTIGVRRYDPRAPSSSENATRTSALTASYSDDPRPL